MRHETLLSASNTPNLNIRNTNLALILQELAIIARIKSINWLFYFTSCILFYLHFFDYKTKFQKIF